MNRSAAWSSQWIFYLTAALLWTAVALRALLAWYGNPVLATVIGLLILWLVLFVSEAPLTRRRQNYFPVYLILQASILCVLLFAPDASDFFAILFGVLCMRIMQQLDRKTGAIWTGAFSILLTILLALNYGLAQGLAFGMIYTAGNVILGSYALAARRAQSARQENQALARQLEQANRALQVAAAQREQLAGARERQHLARELHDAVTQTIFSMTLTTQSARLLLERDPLRVPAQLERLLQLAESALAEMRTLIAELRPSPAGKGLVATLREHIAERQRTDNLTVTLETQGADTLSPRETEQLARIAQEALNNVAKHARVSRAHITLDLRAPCRMEIRDEGAGFELNTARNAARVGLGSMRERAAEIGWDLQIISRQGEGTLIRVTQSLGAATGDQNLFSSIERETGHAGLFSEE